MARLWMTSQLWRSLAYLFTGVIVAVLVLFCLPIAVAAGLIVGAPVAALPVAALERRRLALLGWAVPSPHATPPRPGLVPWLRQRFSEAATWRSLAYAILLATALGVIDLLAVSGVLACVWAAFLWPFFDGRWANTIGLVPLLVLSLILATVVAHWHAWLARGLLGGQAERRMLDLTRSRARLVDVFEIERRRIERDLHDGAQQRLVSLGMTLGLLQHELRSGPPQARELAERAGDQARSALVELRDLVRGIHPQVLTDHGLPAAVSEVADRSQVPVRVVLDIGQRRPTPVVESTAYFVIAEAITNCVKHANASTIAVDGWMADGDRLVVEVRDNGLGGADPTGAGLAGLAERVAAIDGVLTLSSPLGGPTIVRLELPCFASS